MVRPAYVFCGIALLSFSTSARAQVIFSENFNTVTGGTFNGLQVGNTNNVAFGASLSNWSSSGDGAVHVVEYSSGNYAPMFYAGGSANTITTTSGYSANTLGVTYSVSFQMSGAVYQNIGQATTADDKLRIQIISGSNTVSTFDVAPGAWSGNISMVSGSFSYVGDGSGSVNFRITAETPGTSRFSGAIDNFSVSAIPEPSAYAAIGGFAILAFAVVYGPRRRQS